MMKQLSAATTFGSRLTCERILQVAAWACILVAWPNAGAGAEERIIALSGRPPSAGIAADQFHRFDAPPVINNRGQVGFLAGPVATSGQRFSGPTSIWLSGDSGSHLLAASGSVIPSGSGVGVFQAAFTDLNLNDEGRVLFRASYVSDEGSGPSIPSIWQGTPDDLSMIAHVGERVAENRPFFFESFFARPALATDGSSAFFGNFNSAAGSRPLGGGLWLRGHGPTMTAALAGDEAISGNDLAFFAAQSFASPFVDQPVVASGGSTVFRGFLEGPQISIENGLGLWSYHAEKGLELLLRAGAPIPGKNEERFVSFPQSPVINNQGEVVVLAFASQDAQADNHAHDDNHDHFNLSLGIWSNRGGAFAPLLLVGDDVPPDDGVVTGARFIDFGRPLLNGRGDITVVAAIDGADVGDHNQTGVWTSGRGDVEFHLIARAGMPAPGTSAGVVFNSFLEPALNNRGQVAFLADVTGPGISDSEANVLGLWGEDRSGKLQLVARQGDWISVGPDDERRIQAILFTTGSGGEDGRPRGLNDLGQVAFRVRFSDGTSAILTSDALAVPEPGAVALAALSSALVWFFVRLRRSNVGGRAAAAVALVLPGLGGSAVEAVEPDYLFPDLIPFVQEDQAYLVNWFIEEDMLLGEVMRLETVFANVGDGLLQIRVDRGSAFAGRVEVKQRVFIGTDNGRVYEDFPANISTFHPTHGHFHFEDFSEFQLLAVTVDDHGNLGVGDPVTSTVKTSFLIHDTIQLPGPQWADSPSYPSFNLATYQNISVGHGDVYSHYVEGQAIAVADVKRGPLYWLRQTVDPTDVLRETDESNNSFEILIDLNQAGVARRHASGDFVRPGNFYPIVPADLNFDGSVAIDDWLLFREGVGSDLTDLSQGEAYMRGDLNLDGRFSPTDFLLFKKAFDDANGEGALAALGSGISEPGGAVLLLVVALAGASYTCLSRRGQEKWAVHWHKLRRPRFTRNQV